MQSKFRRKSWIFGVFSFLCVLQIEKVLQQGEIGDCADPYMTLRECESKVVRSGISFFFYISSRYFLNPNFKDKCKNS